MADRPFESLRTVSDSDFFSQEIYKPLDSTSSRKWPEWYFARGFGVSQSTFKSWYMRYAGARNNGDAHEISLDAVPEFRAAFSSREADPEKRWWAGLADKRLKKKYHNLAKGRLAKKRKASDSHSDPMLRGQPRQHPQSQQCFHHILYVPATIEKTEGIEEDAHLPCRIPLDSEAHGSLVPRWFGKSNMNMFKKLYPKHLLSYRSDRRQNGRTTAYLHQSLVVAEVLRHKYRRCVHYAAGLPEAQRRIMEKGKKSETWLVMLNLNGSPDPEQVNSIYTELGLVLEMYCDQNSEMMPPRIEWEADRHRMPDIKTLDEVASYMGTWRPKTCFANFKKDTKCALADVRDTVTKETHTADSTGFEAFVGGEKPGPHEFISSTVPFKRYKVHQVYEPSLERFGEFRVFVTTTASSHSTLERDLKVEGVIKTSWVKHGKKRYLHVAAVGENDTWDDYPHLTPKNAHRLRTAGLSPPASRQKTFSKITLSRRPAGYWN
ncbi:hypothetical protein HBI68_255990 [Parastagonospora nodorum]|nr:hypothetical protein HBI68_255990 [Parastagonospora nodorum]